MRYEYKVLKADAPTASEAQLNDFGANGWEIVAIVNWGNAWYYYFKRQVLQ